MQDHHSIDILPNHSIDHRLIVAECQLTFLQIPQTVSFDFWKSTKNHQGPKVRQWLMYCESRGSGTASWMPRQNHYPSYLPCKFKEPANLKFAERTLIIGKLFISHNNQIQILRESKMLFSQSFNRILILFALFDLLARNRHVTPGRNRILDA